MKINILQITFCWQKVTPKTLASQTSLLYCIWNAPSKFNNSWFSVWQVGSGSCGIGSGACGGSGDGSCGVEVGVCHLRSLFNFNFYIYSFANYSLHIIWVVWIITFKIVWDKVATFLVYILFYCIVFESFILVSHRPAFNIL